MAENDTKSLIRINKFLAQNSGISRREADDAISSGRVTINDQLSTIGDRVGEHDIVKLDEKSISPVSSHMTIVLNKPTGYVCTRKRQGDNPTVYDLLPKKYHVLKLVGRLDKDSSGIILLTSDGDLAHSLTHPKFHKTKIYQVVLDKPLQPLHRQMISDFGVMLDDGKSKFELNRVDDKDNKKWQITMREGRNRQIRRTFASLGYNTNKLHRIAFGAYKLDDLPTSQYREVNL